MSEQNGANYDALSDARMRTEVQEVELPGFGDGKPWKPKLKRLSLLGLARSGKIPNELLSAVTELYQYGTVKTPDLKLAAETMYLIAGEALAEPTLTQLEEAGVPLTDEQLAAIYLYARARRGGPAALSSRARSSWSRRGWRGCTGSGPAHCWAFLTPMWPTAWTRRPPGCCPRRRSQPMGTRLGKGVQAKRYSIPHSICESWKSTAAQR